MSTTLKILQEARALVAQQWCQEDMAQNAEGAPKRPRIDDETICAWCSLGAMHQAGLKHGILRYHRSAPDEDFGMLHRDQSFRDAEDLLAQAIGDHEDYVSVMVEENLPWDKEGLIIIWNDDDDRTQEQVVALFEKAMKLAIDAE